MEKKSIHENIEKYSKIEAEKILATAIEDAKKAQTIIMEAAKMKCDQMLENAKKECKLQLEQKKNEYDLAQKQYVNKVERQILDDLSNKALKKLEALRKEELCNLVAGLIAQEEVKGTEIIKVSKKDYKYYLEALASAASKTSKVETDLLNKKLNDDKYQFKLSNEAADIKSGFVLISDDYDLSFGFETLIGSVQESLEKELSEQLFN